MLALHRDDAIPTPPPAVFVEAQSAMMDRGVFSCPWLSIEGDRVFVALSAGHRMCGMGTDPDALWVQLDELDPVKAPPSLWSVNPRT